MRKTPVLTPREAALLVRDGDTLASGGFMSSACPEALSSALEQRFLETGHPRDLTLFFGAGHGNRNGTGGDHYGHAGHGPAGGLRPLGSDPAAGCTGTVGRD